MVKWFCSSCAIVFLQSYLCASVESICVNLWTHFALRASFASLLCFPAKTPKRILRLPFRQNIWYPVQCIDAIQVSQYLFYWKAVSVVFCKHACFDEFRHKVFGRDLFNGSYKES